MKDSKPSQVRSSINLLRSAIYKRKSGVPVFILNDPKWLLNMAINRRAGWPDDPSHSRGSAPPVDGRYPARASGQRFSDLQNIARAVNSRLVVRTSYLGSWRGLILSRIPNRITQPWQE